MKTIKSGIAMLNVLESWGIDRIYGIPGGSFNSTMDALSEKQKTIKYVQVRHEEVGALAAACEAKLSGKIGVCFGTAGPGATHLFNGLYDAKMDHAPVLALVGQVASGGMNYDSFQELNENPMMADVSVYNRTVMTPESLPYVVDEAIRQAYEHKGVAVVTIPVDYGWKDIPDTYVPSGKNHRKAVIKPENKKDIIEAVKLIEKAERPVLYFGIGAKDAGEEILKLAKHFAMPMVSSVPAKGIVAETVENYMGTAGRVSTKPANEALLMSDLIVFAGSDFPFAKYFFPPEAKFIQIDIDSAKLGKRHKTDAAILGDAKEAMQLLVKEGKKKPVSKWYKANAENRKNWLNYLKKLENSKNVPVKAETVFKEINRIAKDDAIFVTDVGNSTIFAVRMLDMNGKKQQFTTSGWFATMGYGVPGGIAAKLVYPKRQIFTLNGDGAFAMVMQDIITQVKYELPIINVVFSNDSLGFIEAEQEDTNATKFGVFLEGADFAKAAEAMGAKGFCIRKPQELKKAFDEAAKSKIPVVIDVKIENSRPYPAESMKISPAKFSEKEIKDFNKRYESDMVTLEDLLK